MIKIEFLRKWQLCELSACLFIGVMQVPSITATNSAPSSHIPIGQDFLFVMF